MGGQRATRDGPGGPGRGLTRPRPDSKQAGGAARAPRQARQQAVELARALGLMGFGIVFLDRAGQVTWMTCLAQEWLKSYFPEECGSGRDLPAEVRGWLEELATDGDDEAAGQTREPLVVERAERRLQVLRVRDSSGDQWLVLSVQDVSRLVAALVGRGLTAREALIMHWMSEGKSNPEIGIILGSSPNTVRKHVQHILAKLDAESRAAAVRQVWEIRSAA
jgi:DNA-binding CsgD family transcriptional regulator